MHLNGNEDWSVEPADPSVGIFADTIVHEGCPDDEPVEATDQIIRTNKFIQENTVETTYIHQVSCPTCGAIYVYPDAETTYEGDD